MDYMSTDFGADSLSNFLLERGQTDKQTDAPERPSHACSNGYSLLPFILLT